LTATAPTARRVLALEPYYGGSHRAFLDGWRAHSRHAWTALTLPAHKWKWRMRHAAIAFAEQLDARCRAGESWDAIVCSDMLNLAEFRGLAPRAVAGLPAVAYFHENQLTYPVRHPSERDYQFAMTNLTTALSATGVWFNSAYHRDALLDAMAGFLRRMPDQQPLEAVATIRRRSRVEHPGIDTFPPRGPRQPGPLRVLWAARWEHDKGPETVFEALDLVRRRGVHLRLSVIGEQFRERPAIFDEARQRFADWIDRWGYQPTRADYLTALREADVMVSTAEHEFFGLAVVEAMAAGAYPLLPRRLSYPELLDSSELPDPDVFLYNGSAPDLADHLALLAARLDRGDLWPRDPACCVRAAGRFAWPRRAAGMDAGVAGVVSAGNETNRSGATATQS